MDNIQNPFQDSFDDFLEPQLRKIDSLKRVIGRTKGLNICETYHSQNPALTIKVYEGDDIRKVIYEVENLKLNYFVPGKDPNKVKEYQHFKMAIEKKKELTKVIKNLENIKEKGRPLALHKRY